MNINLSRIINTKGASLQVCFDELPMDLNILPEDVELTKPVHFSGTVTNVGGLFQVQGIMHIIFCIDCARCSSPVEQELSIEINEQYSNRLLDMDEEVFSFEGNEISLDEMIIHNILIHLPMRAVCSSENDCAPYKDFTYEDDNQEDDDIDPRLSKLRDLFKED